MAECREVLERLPETLADPAAEALVLEHTETCPSCLAAFVDWEETILALDQAAAALPPAGTIAAAVAKRLAVQNTTPRALPASAPWIAGGLLVVAGIGASLFFTLAGQQAPALGHAARSGPAPSADAPRSEPAPSTDAPPAPGGLDAAEPDASEEPSEIRLTWEPSRTTPETPPLDPSPPTAADGPPLAPKPRSDRRPSSSEAVRRVLRMESELAYRMERGAQVPARAVRRRLAMIANGDAVALSQARDQLAEGVASLSGARRSTRELVIEQLDLLAAGSTPGPTDRRGRGPLRFQRPAR